LINNLLIFGTTPYSSLLADAFIFEENRVVSGFVVDSSHIKSATFDLKPVYAFESILKSSPPEAHSIIFPLGWKDMNLFRAKKIEHAKIMGYEIESFISKGAIVHRNVEIKENTLVYEGAIIQPKVQLGSNVTIRAGANIGHQSTIGDNVFISSGVITGGFVDIGSNSVIGLGAILREGISIAPGCFIGMGAVVVKNTEANGVYIGNPARRTTENPLVITM
jgi:sugar O-acyltransferase (sialic acid O-acetyltransferase NeuD family)